MNLLARQHQIRFKFCMGQNGSECLFRFVLITRRFRGVPGTCGAYAQAAPPHHHHHHHHHYHHTTLHPHITPATSSVTACLTAPLPSSPPPPNDRRNRSKIEVQITAAAASYYPQHERRGTHNHHPRHFNDGFPFPEHLALLSPPLF